MKRKSRRVQIGNVAIGGSEPIAVQSMTNTETADVAATVNQIQQLAEAGCEIVRVAVKNKAAAKAFAQIKNSSPMPVVADIHFNADLAIQAIEAGADKIRINPGTIGPEDRVKRIVEAAGEAKIPIRIGVNSGSLAEPFLEAKASMGERLSLSAVHFVELFESWGFSNIVLSLKATSVTETIAANRSVAGLVDYPLHLGVTEAGTVTSGTVKSAVGIGILLAEGIGDTIRVSLTGDPVEEVRIAYQILGALDLRRRGATVISCPTCGRCEIDLAPVADEVERRLAGVREPISVAVMGCIVNGPGEAREADIGLAGGKGQGLLFVEGRPAGKVSEARMVEALMSEVDKLLERWRAKDAESGESEDE